MFLLQSIRIALQALRVIRDVASCVSWCSSAPREAAPAPPGRSGHPLPREGPGDRGGCRISPTGHPPNSPSAPQPIRREKTIRPPLLDWHRLDRGLIPPGRHNASLHGRPRYPRPDEIVMDETTKQLVDGRWSDYGIDQNRIEIYPRLTGKAGRREGYA